VFEKDETRKFDFAIYPNPATDKIFVSGLPQGRSDVELLDVLGRSVIKRVAGAHGVNETSLEIDRPKVASGFYYISVFHANEVVTKPVIIR
jgi:hypothetical protein